MNKLTMQTSADGPGFFAERHAKLKAIALEQTARWVMDRVGRRLWGDLFDEPGDVPKIEVYLGDGFDLPDKLMEEVNTQYLNSFHLMLWYDERRTTAGYWVTEIDS
jgi:hypothetical protein